MIHRVPPAMCVWDLDPSVAWTVFEKHADGRSFCVPCWEWAELLLDDSLPCTEGRRLLEIFWMAAGLPHEEWPPLLSPVSLSPPMPDRSIASQTESIGSSTKGVPC